MSNPFPCTEVPADAPSARLLGIYPQRQPGQFMQRVKVPQGRLSPAQFRGLAALATRFAPTRAFHITTRQDVEFHGLSENLIPALQSGVADLGLSSRRSCGDTVRNVVGCPSDGFQAGTWAVGPLVDGITHHVETLPWIEHLPRKFKISVSGCPDACARPWINDLGFAINSDGTFYAVAAGSLGIRPLAGLRLYDVLTWFELLPLTVAVLKLFNELGDRTNRSRARLRYVRERLGDEEFRARVERHFREELDRDWPSAPQPSRIEIGTPLQHRLTPPLGNVTVEAAEALASSAEASGAHIRLGLEHDVYLFGKTPLSLGPLWQNALSFQSVVSCPGAATCVRAITHSQAVAGAIAEAIGADSPIQVSVSGCPNNCSQAAIADLGLVGRIRQIGEQRVECYQVFAGGGHGGSPLLGQLLHPGIRAEQVPAFVAAMASRYRDAKAAQRITFADFVARNVETLRQLGESLSF